MIYVAIFLWYLSGWCGIALFRRDWCRSFPEETFFCVSPAQYLGCAIGALGGLGFLFLGVIIFLLGTCEDTKLGNWFTRPVCKRKR